RDDPGSRRAAREAGHVREQDAPPLAEHLPDARVDGRDVGAVADPFVDERCEGVGRLAHRADTRSCESTAVTAKSAAVGTWSPRTRTNQPREVRYGAGTPARAVISSSTTPRSAETTSASPLTTSGTMRSRPARGASGVPTRTETCAARGAPI